MNAISHENKETDELMVKFMSQGDDREPSCYICAALSPQWHVFAKPQNSSVKSPFFPFLEYHEPSANARPIDKQSGKVDVCAVCFSFLTQQWRAFEEKETPLVKRIYWLKRPGHDEGFDREEDRGCGIVDKEDDSDAREYCQHSKVKSLKDQTHERNEPLTKIKDYKDTINNDSLTSKDTFEVSMLNENKKESCLEVCFVCSREKPKEFMRSVHTRPQLKTETPFYPCLAKHNPTLHSKKMDFLGKVLVCEACQKFLFRQWQVFQKNNTPLTERQYQLRCDPSLPRDQQSQLSTMVCFICGVAQPATSGRFLYSLKQPSGDPYYPFLSKLTPPPGAMPLTKQGLTRACSGCRKSLHRQWKEYEAREIPDEQREYRIRNEGATPSEIVTVLPTPSMHIPNSMTPESCQDVSDIHMSRLKCYVCSESFDEACMRPIYTKENTNHLKENFYFPIIAMLNPPVGCRKLDNIGRTLVCKNCYKFLHRRWEHYEHNKVPQHKRTYSLDHKIDCDKLQKYMCFLCGTECTDRTKNYKLYSFPHSGEGVQDGGSFFPFLASREPRHNAKPISPEGTVLTCEICFNNLMIQWCVFENSDIPEEANRWLRKYRIDHIICFSCGQLTPRSYCQAVNKLLVVPKHSTYPPARSVVTNKGQNAVVCRLCYQLASKNELSDNSVLVSSTSGVQNQEYKPSSESKRSHSSSQHQKPSFSKSVIVIDSDDSDNDESTYPIDRYNNNLPRSGGYRHANVPPMHYTASVSPGVNTQPSKDHTNTDSPSMQPSTSRSFAAALRKLAKQAMPPGTSSPVTTSPNGSQPASPTVSHASSRSTGVSPSRNSPAATHTPPPPRGDVNKERMSSHNSERELSSIATPTMPPIPALESDNPNTSEPNRVPSRGPHRIASKEQLELVGGQGKGHEVLPGIYSTRPRFSSEAPMLSDHYANEHGHPTVVPYYLHGGRPDVPLFIPRAGPIPGPPPLLGSKREGGEPHGVSPFFQGPFPPPSMMDSAAADLHFETWRQQRAVEHLRQQQERQDLPRPSHSDRSSPQTNTTDKDKPKERPPSEGHEHMPYPHRMYYESKPPSCPVHGHSPGESHHKHPPGRTDTHPAPKPERPEEFNRMFLPPHPDGAAMLHPYLVHPSRDGPFGPHHLGERHPELFRDRERQEMMLHQRMMIDQRDHIKAREEEWQRRQQRLRQEKEDHQREMVHYRHQVLQQQREMDQPSNRREQSPHDSRRNDQRHPEHRERTNKSPHSNERPKPDHPIDSEIYRHYPFHPAFHPMAHDIRGRHPFADFHRKEGEIPRSAMEAIKDGRPHLHPFSMHDHHYPPFSDPYPFHRDSRAPSSSVSDRILSESRWTTHTRPTFMNGDLRVVDIHQSDISNKLSEELKSQLKKEGIDSEQLVMTKKHDKDKLRFLEGLGLVTLEKKKELTHGDLGVKKKLEESPLTVSQEDKASTDSTGQREDNEGTSSDGTTDADSGTTSTDTETSHVQYTEKVKFMARLGLVPPHTRHEMEKSFEFKRSERKKRKKKGRGRPSKRTKKEQASNDTENGRTSIDAENLVGPMTRQKQQLLDQGLIKHTEQKTKMEENGDISKELNIKIKKEAPEQSTSPYPYTQENQYKSNSSQGQRNASPTEHLTSRPPPRLTLQSLTNMEDPFNSYNTPTFRPPYLRHTGLLSVSAEHTGHPAIVQPLRPEPIHSTGLSLSEQETREYLARHGSPNLHPDFSRHFGMLQSHHGSSFEKLVPVHAGRPHEADLDKKDPGSRAPLPGRKEHEYRWPGVESVMKAYFLHSGDRDHEASFLRENADVLKSQHASLNEEASNLNTQMTNLVQAKKHLHDEKKACQENLDRLHYFMQSFQR